MGDRLNTLQVLFIFMLAIGFTGHVTVIPIEGVKQHEKKAVHSVHAMHWFIIGVLRSEKH